MPSPRPPLDDSAPDPKTPNPRRASAVKDRPQGYGPSTPMANRRASAGITPKSAPAAGDRQRSTSKKPEATLLSDFLLGRPTPGRASATRRKTVDTTAAKAEMRQASVRKLERPGGVRDRVKAWQKENAAAMWRGNPNDAASEPPDVLDLVDAESVTEEDRLRIKFRKKPKRSPKQVGTGEGNNSRESGDDDENGVIVVQEDVPGDPRLSGPPKKRIISDDNWMKRSGKNSPLATSPARRKDGGSPTPSPGSYPPNTAMRSSAQDKIKDWAMKVETPRPAKAKQYRATSGETVTVEEGDDGIRIKPLRPRKRTSDDGIRVKPMKTEAQQDDGIRVTPVRNKTYEGDGIRIKPHHSSVPDDGIRVRPVSSRVASTDGGVRVPSSTRHEYISPDCVGETEESSKPETPTRQGGSGRRGKQRQNPRATHARKKVEDMSDKSSMSGESVSSAESDRPSSAPATSLADIPFGYSAFSVLDLPVGADAHNTKPPKAQRNPSFKAVPKVFKKVVSEGKKIIHDKVDPPRPSVNQPRSIESWLNNTVDPFVDSSAPKRSPVEKEWGKESRKRSSSEIPARDSQPTEQEQPRENDENVDRSESEDPDKTPTKKNANESPSSGLKRSRATRSASSPLKPGARKPFREALKQAFRGESGGHKMPPMTYPSCKSEQDDDVDGEDPSRGGREQRRRSSGSAKRSPSPDDQSTEGSGQEPGAAPVAAPRRRPPPTNGLHELSTIASVETLSTHDADAASAVSHTTITQATAFTKSTSLSRQKSQKTGLKRRLTKHSDLVSVLSLPDNSEVPVRGGSIRYSGSLHRKTSKIGSATMDDLLNEFEADENLYQRELKTLVDGVVPVLLTQVVHSTSGSSADFFGPDDSNDQQQAQSMGKAVVNMGIALEKLKNFHRRVPLADTSRLLAWLESVHPIYDNYLDVWRLGFQGVIVNLAPADGKADDEDSLLDAMPRNENGDVLDDNGERVDVAYLLKRPLVRIKWLLKFIRGALMILGSSTAAALLVKFEKLVDKARQRHREESARTTDEDANSTDTTRARDLRDLAPMEGVLIDSSRQVNAKDAFALDLSHSSGQRLECQVELIFRDNLQVPTDKGDILVREAGIGGRSWLLFPPIPKAQVSARRGSHAKELVVMVRGVHSGGDWYELLALSADSMGQVLDWLEILGSNPVPPDIHPAHSSQGKGLANTTKGVDAEIPLGERKPRRVLTKSAPEVQDKTQPRTPGRYHPRHAGLPATPTSSSPAADSSPSSDKTPTQASYLKESPVHKSPEASLETGNKQQREEVRPGPAKLQRSRPNSTPYREDGAPPPPVHRTLTPKASSPLSAPVELPPSSRVKRRTSSPLKHEYRPSDASSSSSDTVGSESESESSGDELDEADVPDLMPGLSIKKEEHSPAESVISDTSLTPSNSASQAGRHGPQKGKPEYSIKTIATISYWSNKRGIWKDISQDDCSVVIMPGVIEAHPLNASHSAEQRGQLDSSGTSDLVDGSGDAGAVRPLIALDLTPHVMIRQSTVVDLEVRSPVREYSQLNKIESAIFRFRAPSSSECSTLYMAVHRARLDNAKYKAIEEENRIRSFGQQQQEPADGDGDSSSRRRRSWFGRKNSYRASTRAPSQSQGSSSSMSASSFLKKLTGGSNSSFNINRSSVDKQSRAGSGSGSGSGGPASLYTSGSSSAGGGAGSTPPRSPSVSQADSGSRAALGGKAFGSDNLRIRCHLLVTSSRWEDNGNCTVQITRPPPGMRQELNLYHGMPKRVIIKTVPKKEGEAPSVVMDAVLGSGCFGRLGTRGIVLNVWEEVRDERNVVGVVPAEGAAGGRLKKWCWQCGSVAEATWIWGLVTSEVVIA